MPYIQVNPKHDVTKRPTVRMEAAELLALLQKMALCAPCTGAACEGAGK